MNPIEPDKQQLAKFRTLTAPQWWRCSELKERGARIAIETALDDVKFNYKLTDEELKTIVDGVLAGM